MDKEVYKGDFLIMDDNLIIKRIYLYPSHEDTVIENGETNSDEEDDEKVVNSLISNVKDECTAQIIKIYKNNLVVVVEDKKLDFIKENESIKARITKGNYAYECSLIILGMKTEEEKLILVLSIPIIEKPLDRRRFFRLKLRFGVRYCLIPEGKYHTLIDIPKGCFLKTKKTLSQDISAGGITIISQEQCEVNTYVLVCLYLPNKIDILCKVTRVIPDKNETKSSLSMEYVYIDEADRDKIVEFIIKNEIARRQRDKKNKEMA